MSGGHYNYLYRADPSELLERGHDLTAVRNRLTDLGMADAAAAVDEIIATVTRYRHEAESRMERLAEILRAVEWEDSNDGYEGQIEDAVEKYRAAVKP